MDWRLNPVGFGPSGVLVEQAAAGHLRTSGFTGGGQIGLGKQFDMLVFGIEGDLQYTGLSGSRSGGAIVPPGIFDSFTQSMESRWLGTLRGRLGDRVWILASLCDRRTLRRGASVTATSAFLRSFRR